MKKVLTIWKKEALGYGTSLRAYVMIGLMLFLSSAWFAALLAFTRESNIKSVISLDVFILLAVTPMLTMRSLAEENSRGTLEFILTSPVTEWEVVLGKFLGSLTPLLALYGILLIFPAILWKVGEPQWGPVLTQFALLIGTSAAFISVGLFASAVTESQVIAALVSYVLLLMLWIVGIFAQVLPANYADIARDLAISQHQDNFLKGVLDATDCYYYIAVTAAFLFLTYRAVEARRWAA